MCSVYSPRMVAFYVEAAPGTHAALEGLDVFAGADATSARRVDLDALDVRALPAGVTASPGATALGTPATVLHGLSVRYSRASPPWWSRDLDGASEGERLLPVVVLVVG